MSIQKHVCGRRSDPPKSSEECGACIRDARIAARHLAFEGGKSSGDESPEQPITNENALATIATELRGIRRAFWELHDRDSESALLRNIDRIADGLHAEGGESLTDLLTKARDRE